MRGNVRQINLAPNYYFRVDACALRLISDIVQLEHCAMTTLLLSPTRKHYRIGDKDDYVVLDGGRVIAHGGSLPHR